LTNRVLFDVGRPASRPVVRTFAASSPVGSGRWTATFLCLSPQLPSQSRRSQNGTLGIFGFVLRLAIGPRSLLPRPLMPPRLSHYMPAVERRCISA